MQRGDSAELICRGCTQDLGVGEEYLQCMVKPCGKLYHLLCTNKNSIPLEHRDTWVCPECCIAFKKSGRNCDTPVGTPLSVKNITLRSRNDAPIAETQCTDNAARIMDSSIIGDISAYRNINTNERRRIPSVSSAQDLNADMFRTIIREEMQVVLGEQNAILLSRFKELVSRIDVLEALIRHKNVNTGVDSTTIIEESAIHESCSGENPPIPAVDETISAAPGLLEPSPQKAAHSARQATKEQNKQQEAQVSVGKKKKKKRNEQSTNASKGSEKICNTTPLSPKLTAENKVSSNDAPLAVLGVTGGQEPRDISDKTDHEAFKDARTTRLRSSTAGVTRGTADVGCTMLQAAERRHYLHLYYIKEGTTEAQVRQHLSAIVGSDICGVHALKARGDYASFKLSVPSSLVESVMASENWPKGVCVKPWLQNFRAKSVKKNA